MVQYITQRGKWNPDSAYNPGSTLEYPETQWSQDGSYHAKGWSAWKMLHPDRRWWHWHHLFSLIPFLLKFRYNCKKTIWSNWCQKFLNRPWPALECSPRWRLLPDSCIYHRPPAELPDPEILVPRRSSTFRLCRLPRQRTDSDLVLILWVLITTIFL